MPAPKRVDSFGENGVFLWQKALHVACDLPEPVRYSLAVLALYMDTNGTSGRPGTTRFMLARRKSEKTVRRHLEQAIEAGWLIRERRGGRSGNGSTRASCYVAALPAAVYEQLQQILAPAWGDHELAQPVTHGRPVEPPVSSGHPRRPVDAPAPLPQPVIQQDQQVISAVSTGHPGRPTTDQSYRPTSPLSRLPHEPEQPPAPPEREIDSLTKNLMAQHNATEAEVTAVLGAARRDGVRAPAGWARSQAGREDFARRLADVRQRPANSRHGQTCVECGQQRRSLTGSGVCLPCLSGRSAEPAEMPAAEPTTAETFGRCADCGARVRPGSTLCPPCKGTAPKHLTAVERGSA